MLDRPRRVCAHAGHQFLDVEHDAGRHVDVDLREEELLEHRRRAHYEPCVGCQLKEAYYHLVAVPPVVGTTLDLRPLECPICAASGGSRSVQGTRLHVRAAVVLVARLLTGCLRARLQPSRCRQTDSLFCLDPARL